MSETLVTSIPALEPGERLLCGPGPSNVNPKVLEAMGNPMNGHLDPDFWDILLDLIAGPAGAVAASRRLSLSLQRLRAPPAWKPASRTSPNPATR